MIADMYCHYMGGAPRPSEIVAIVALSDGRPAASASGQVECGLATRAAAPLMVSVISARFIASRGPQRNVC
jgi:hypothetical protein